MGKLIIFIGAPGSGKSSRGKECEEKGYRYIQTSAELEKLGYNTADPKSIPLIVTIDIIKEAVSKEEKVIVDGFPRNLMQAEEMRKQGIEVNHIVYFKISKPQAMERIINRVICPKCKRSYAENNSCYGPKMEGICDQCKELLIKRDSDNIQIFNRRFEFFCRCTYPLLEYYRQRNVKVTIVDALSNKFDIF